MNRFGKLNSFHWVTVVALSVLLSGCGEEVQRSLRPIPTAFGKLNQLVVIADQDVWDGPVGDTLRYYYSTAFPILPQPEPILDLNHFTAEQLTADVLRKELRNYMFVANLSDEQSMTTKLVKNDIGQENLRRAREEEQFSSVAGRDKWAKGQLLVYQFAQSREELIQVLKRNFPAVLKRIHEADSKKLEATIYLDGESYQLKEEISSKMGINLRVPNDYFLATSKDNFIWMRKETPKFSSNIMLHKVKYTDQDQLSKAGIKAIRDSLGRKYITSTLPNTYMQINDIDLPLLVDETNLDGHYALEARGIWEIVNDYMGGAFISYLVHDPENNQLVFLDGFVHAPGEEKRNNMQYLEYILNTAKI